MWNTMECKSDSFSDLGGAKETHWERISHARNGFILQTSDTFSTYDHRGCLKLITPVKLADESP